MLHELHIQNLAVVADVTLSFEEGLNVLTGSTGAGKSLILGAVNCLLGARVGVQAIRAGEEKAVVEGSFRLSHLSGAVADPDGLLQGSADRLSLRREVHRSGRSFAYVNGKPCTVKQLQTLSQQLIEPHGQNEQLRLKFPESHVVYLDRFAAHPDLIARFSDALARFKDADGELREFDARIAVLKEKKELFEHRLGEIERARIAPGEKQKLEESLRVLENASDVFEGLAEVEKTVYEDDASAVALVARARARLSRLAHLDAKFEAFLRELESAEIGLTEVARSARAYLDGFEFEPDELERKQNRLALLSEFERRYRMPLEELLAESERWKQELGLVEFEDEERGKLSGRRAELLTAVCERALALRASRVKAARELDKAMTRELGGLMMPGARFRTDVAVDEGEAGDVKVDGCRVRVGAGGIDRVEFCVQTNPGESEGPLAEIASSGELSRIALALKEIVSVGAGGGGKGSLGALGRSGLSRVKPSGSADEAGAAAHAGPGSLLVFDEVDVGVGADLGDVIAARIQRLAQSYQIVCITHMPQIAARAVRHLVVGKRSSGGRTFTEVAEVRGDERVREIARMLGGREGSEKRLALAREMLQKDRGKTTSQVRP
jgi:DNA repair protein RecN (Recombination protein N)